MKHKWTEQTVNGNKAAGAHSNNFTMRVVVIPKKNIEPGVTSDISGHVLIQEGIEPIARFTVHNFFPPTLFFDECDKFEDRALENTKAAAETYLRGLVAEEGD